jgi:uncharacterized protein
MNAQEQEQLSSFLDQLVSARVTQKDADAEALIREAFRKQTDAGYLLVQKALILDQALKNAQYRNEQLHRDMDALRAATPQHSGFVDANSWGVGSTRAPAASPLVAPMVPTAPAAGNSWGAGWLGQLATTAAGVVAGSFLFQGIEHLLGHHDNNGGWLGGNSLSALPQETSVVNNYYQDSTPNDDIANVDILDDSGTDSGDDWV